MAGTTTMEHVIHMVEQCINRNDFRDLGKRLDEAELMNPEAFQTKSWPHGIHLLSHLTDQDLPNARFMFKRIPENIVSEDVAVQKAYVLLQKFWTKDYQEVWETIHSSWPSQYAMIMEHLSLSTRREIFKIVQASYIRIDIKKLSIYLGCTIEEALVYSEECGARHEDSFVIMPGMPHEERLSESEIQKLQSILVQLGQ